MPQLALSACIVQSLLALVHILACCRAVALTVPAYVAADLVSSSCPEAAKGLASLDYPPVAAVSVAYPLSTIRQDRLDAAGKLPGALPRMVGRVLC